MKKFLVKYYQVIFYSSLIEGIIFLVLFLSGVIRYRFALVVVLIAVISTANQYLITRGSKINLRWGQFKFGLMLLLIISMMEDFAKGRIYPRYLTIPLWETVIFAGVGYFIAFLLHLKLGHLAQQISGNDIFTVCPNCGFANVQVVEQCKNCGYKNGMPIQELARESEIPEELKQEIEAYRKVGLLKKIPKEVLRGLKLSEDEHVLMAMKSPNLFYFNSMDKNEKRMSPGWFIMTNKRIICYYGVAAGWVGLDFIPYSEIKEVNIVKRPVAYTMKDKLKIDTLGDSFLFLFGKSKEKLFKRILLHDATNEPILSSIVKCIYERKQMGAHNYASRPEKADGHVIT